MKTFYLTCHLILHNIPIGNSISWSYHLSTNTHTGLRKFFAVNGNTPTKTVFKHAYGEFFGDVRRHAILTTLIKNDSLIDYLLFGKCRKNYPIATVNLSTKWPLHLSGVNNFFMIQMAHDKSFWLNAVDTSIRKVYRLTCTIRSVNI
jgi:hypothetical protein